MDHATLAQMPPSKPLYFIKIKFKINDNVDKKNKNNKKTL